MKNALFALVVIACATPILAQDGSIVSQNIVSQNALRSLGLNDLQPMSEAEGNQIRGKFNRDGGAIGTSLIFFQLLTPDSYNFVDGSSVNTVFGKTQFGRTRILAPKTLPRAPLVEIGPPITLDVGKWLGSVIGSRGGNGMLKVGF